jgi:hypothetical protein
MWRRFPEAAGAPTALARKPLVGFSSVLVEGNSSTVSWHSFSGSWRKTRLLTSRPPFREFVRGPHRMSPCYTDLSPASCFFRYRVSCQVLYDHIPCAVQEEHGGSTVLGRRPITAGIHQCSGFLSSAVGSGIWPDIGPAVLRQSPQRLLH